MAKITVTIVGADEQLSKKLTSAISLGKGYKYTYLKQLLTRLRIVRQKVINLPEEEQLTILSNTLITERNIANFAADKYAELNMDELFDSFADIASDIDELFK